jgi:hypothetical protein
MSLEDSLFFRALFVIPAIAIFGKIALGHSQRR